MADSQNKAIMLFTGVTIVFLPLSFFTSYFGMNLSGIIDTDKDEKYFWETCGSTSFLIAFLLALYAFRNEIQRRLMGQSGWLRGLDGKPIARLVGKGM